MALLLLADATAEQTGTSLPFDTIDMHCAIERSKPFAAELFVLLLGQVSDDRVELCIGDFGLAEGRHDRHCLPHRRSNEVRGQVHTVFQRRWYCVLVALLQAIGARWRKTAHARQRRMATKAPLDIHGLALLH